jgi:hypothetical protein
VPTEGSFNTGIGEFALVNNTSGESNTAVGHDALGHNTTAGNNTAIGSDTLFDNTIGASNTAGGAFALEQNTTGDNNTAIGVTALSSNITGGDNAALGAETLQANTSGDFNTAGGNAALFRNTTGDDNTAFGNSALFNNTGHDNTAVGFQALAGNTSGSFNIALGNRSGANVTTASNVICIGTGIGENESNGCFIGNVFNTSLPGANAVLINPNGKLGTATSSRRFKYDIKPMNDASEVLFALKPVTFRYRRHIDPTATSQFGLVAEEVEEVSRDLIVRDKEGRPYSVRYDQVNAMLLNEFLKEHKKIEEQAREIREQKAAIKRLGKRVETVLAHIKERKFESSKMNEHNKASRLVARPIRHGASMPHIVSND